VVSLHLSSWGIKLWRLCPYFKILLAMCENEAKNTENAEAGPAV